MVHPTIITPKPQIQFGKLLHTYKHGLFTETLFGAQKNDDFTQTYVQEVKLAKSAWHFDAFCLLTLKARQAENNCPAALKACIFAFR